jgi:plastocyanin
MRVRAAALFLGMMLLAAAALAQGGRGTIAGKVEIREKDGSPRSDRSGAVVFVTGALPARKGSPRKLEIKQVEQKFLPPFQVVVQGETMDFPNEDKIFHNVFSVSQPARFDLGLYKSGDSKSVTFKREGTVDVYCNIHPEMVAKIKVVPNAYYAVTDREGRFRIEGVPAGAHQVRAWIPRGEEAVQTIEVPAGKEASIEFSLIEVETKKRHLRKDGTPYGRYK